MIFIVSNDGRIVTNISESVSQGSVNSNVIYLLAPFPQTESVTVSFLLPNGQILAPSLAKPMEMTPLGGLTETINNVNGEVYSGWSYPLPAAVTGYYGNVTAQFFFHGQNGVITATSATTFPVNKGVPIIPVEEDTGAYNAVLEELSRLNTALTNGDITARSIFEWRSGVAYNTGEITFVMTDDVPFALVKSLVNNNSTAPYNESGELNSESWELLTAYGVRFTPSVSGEGVLTWTNNGDLPNPEPVNIKGPIGPRGQPIYYVKRDAIENIGETLPGLSGNGFFPELPDDSTEFEGGYGVSQNGYLIYIGHQSDGDGGYYGYYIETIKNLNGMDGENGEDGVSVEIVAGRYYDPTLTYPEDIPTTDLTPLPAFNTTEEGSAYVVDDNEIKGQVDLYFHGVGGTTWTIIDDWGGIPGQQGVSITSVTSAGTTSAGNAYNVNLSNGDVAGQIVAPPGDRGETGLPYLFCGIPIDDLTTPTVGMRKSFLLTQFNRMPVVGDKLVVFHIDSPNGYKYLVAATITEVLASVARFVYDDFQIVTGNQGAQGVGIASVTFKETNADGGNIYNVNLSNGEIAGTITAPKGATGSGGSITVDSTFSTTSQNPLQNKVVTNAFGLEGGACHYGTCDTVANNTTKIVTLSDTSYPFVLATGARIFVKFRYGDDNANGKSLRVGNTAAKVIADRVGNSLIGKGHWEDYEIIEFVYSGSRWCIVNKYENKFTDYKNWNMSSTNITVTDGMRGRTLIGVFEGEYEYDPDEGISMYYYYPFEVVIPTSNNKYFITSLFKTGKDGDVFTNGTDFSIVATYERISVAPNVIGNKYSSGWFYYKTL